MFHNPHHAKEIAKIPKWIYLMLHMLMKPRESSTGTSETNERPDSPRSELLKQREETSADEMVCIDKYE